jgi:catechol 2,3-dioxygenase-like lactoylglutathione lyase family enzyme
MAGGGVDRLATGERTETEGKKKEEAGQTHEEAYAKAGRRFCKRKESGALSSMIALDRIDHVALAVHDVEKSAGWYADVLGFERHYDDVWNGYPVFVGKGNVALALFPLRGEGAANESSTREEPRVLHFAFRATRKNFLAAQTELKGRGIEFEFNDHTISHSIYFRDPDGHKIEITTYEL